MGCTHAHPHQAALQARGQAGDNRPRSSPQTPRGHTCEPHSPEEVQSTKHNPTGLRSPAEAGTQGDQASYSLHQLGSPRSKQQKPCLPAPKSCISQSPSAVSQPRPQTGERRAVRLPQDWAGQTSHKSASQSRHAGWRSWAHSPPQVWSQPKDKLGHLAGM